MNSSVNRENFNTLGEREIANFIEQAKNLIILAIPSMTNMIANSLLNSNVSNLQIIISKLDSMDNRSLEHSNAVKNLLDNNILLRVSESFSLGAFIVDDRGWLFTPEVLPVNNVNCFSVSTAEVQKLISGLSAIVVQEHVNEKDKPELGENILTKQDLLQEVEKEQKVLEEKFDIERIQNLDIEFVETEFKGLRIGTKKVSIPKELTTLGMDDNVKDILSSTAKLFGGEHEFSIDLKNIEVKRNKLREDYLITLGDYGLVIQKHMKKEFNEALDNINKETDELKEKISKTLFQELEKTKQSLINYYFPIVKENPPSNIRKVNKIVNDESIRSFLEVIFQKNLPNIDKLVDEIQLQYRYKGLTIELMKDEKFIKALKSKGVEI